MFFLQHCHWVPSPTLVHTSPVQSFIQSIRIIIHYLQSLNSILAQETEHKKISDLLKTEN